MAENNKTAEPPKKGQKQGGGGRGSAQIRPDRFAFTIDAKTGHIVQVEGIDAAGTRHELSRDEALDFARENGRARLEQLLEEAFEAGIACVLGDEEEAEEAGETDADDDLRRILLKPLIEAGPVARLMRADVLDRAIVETLIHNSLAARSGRAPGRGAPRDNGSERDVGPAS